MSTGMGGCLPSLDATFATGVLNGTCEATTGYGTVSGRSFTAVGSNYALTLTGEVYGTITLLHGTTLAPCGFGGYRAFYGVYSLTFTS